MAAISVFFMRTLILFGTRFQYSRKRRQDEEGKQSEKAAIRDLLLTFCPTMRSIQQRKLKLLMPVLVVHMVKTEVRRLSLGITLNKMYLMKMKGCAVLATYKRGLLWDTVGGMRE